MKLIDGKKTALEIQESLAKEIKELKQQHNASPGLAVIIVGENPASKIYVEMKTKACEKTGIYSQVHKLKKETSEPELMALIEKLNADDQINGILVQLPLPKHINEHKIINLISIKKDVDGFHPENVGKMLIGEEKDIFLPCTPFGIQMLLIKNNIQTEGKHVVIVGRSNIVGKPIANILLQKGSSANATITICHSQTKNISFYTKQADILIAAIGKPNFITSDMIKEGAVVIDVGINRINDPKSEKGYQIVGDVDFENVKEKTSAITPVPGGVGPMTIAMLLYNTVQSFKQARK